ncbi:MAG: hypothetical protein IKN32_00845 [Bacteroidales bacterium]|nr:hypothetical protein [Bacteroidales bacterium]
MEENGKLYWEAGIDNSRLQQDGERAKQILQGIGTTATEAGKRSDAAMKALEQIVNEVTKSFTTQEDVVTALSAAYDQLTEEAKGLESSDQREFIDEVTDGLKELIAQIKNAGKEPQSAKQALREMTDELANMKLRGEENTEEYRQLLEKVGMLKDALMDTQQAVKGMASDTAALDSVLGAANLTAGGFSAIMGAMNLAGVGEDTKELAEAQKKLQAAIAITTGLQSVQNALQKQSALMLGIQKIQTLAAAKAENIKTAATGKGVIATKAATVAQALFNKVAMANPYVLLAMALVTVVGALVAFSKGSKEAKKREEELQKETERATERFNEFKSAVSSSVGRVVGQFSKLQAQWRKLRDEASKKKWIDDNATAFNSLGIKVNDVNSAEKVFVEQADAVIAALKAKAEAAAILDLYAENYKKVIEAQLEADKKVKAAMNEPTSEFTAGSMFGSSIPERWQEAGLEERAGDLDFHWGGGQSGTGWWYLTEQGAQKYYDYVRQQGQEEVSRVEAEGQAIYELWETAETKAEEAANAIQGLLTTTTTTTTTVDSTLADELKKARERAEDLENDNEADTVEGRVRKINTTYGRLIAEAARKAAEAENAELAGYYQRQVAALTERRRAEIQKVYDDEAKAAREAIDAILDKYTTYIDRRKAIIEQSESDIAKLREQYDSTEDQEERLRIERAIAEANQQQADALLDLEVEYGALNRAAQERSRLEQQLVIEQGKLYEALQAEDYEEEVERLRAEIERIRKQIKAIDDATEAATKEPKSLADAWREVVEEIKDADLETQLEAVGSFFDKMSSVEGSQGFANIGKIISSLGNPVQLFGSIVDIFVSDYEKNMERVNAIAEAKMQARLEALQAHYDELLGGSGNIFGQDVLESTRQYVQLLREIENRNKYAAARRAFGNHLDIEKILAGDYTGFNQQAVDKAMGYTSEKITFRTNKTFLGLFDEYMTFTDLSEQFGIELYDKYGNLNAELAQKILETYEGELLPSEKQFLEEVIQDSDAYKDALDGVANYISDLFGSVADTIADDFINSFLESGEAAVDFGAVVSDVSKQMVKDLVKSKILAAMDPFSEQINNIMTGDGTQEEKAAQIMAVFASMQEVMDGLAPDIQALLEGYQQFFNLGDEREGATKGIAQASQDSVDELNGRMTAVQGHTYSISENTKLLLQNTQNILESVMNIEQDTGDISSRLTRVETETSRMRSTLDDIRQNGIKIR